MQLLDELRSIMWPDVSPSVMRNIDSEGMQGINYATSAVSVVVTASLVFFIATRQHIDESTLLTATSMVVCGLFCIVGHAISRNMIKHERIEHKSVVAFTVILFVAISFWSIVASYARYTMGTQMLTFFMVCMMAMSFLVCTPWLAVALMGTAYALLYAAMYVYDHAAHVNGFNYVVLMVLTMVGMVVRFHVELKASQKAVELQYVSRHDELTGLLNRKALDEDMDTLLNKKLSVHLIDLNYFKEINDTYGHLTGDHVLRETARFLQDLYSTELVYRFGGDEFLVLESGSNVTPTRDTYVLAISFEGMSFDIRLSIGTAEGTVRSVSDINALILEADKYMYTVKSRTHAQA